MICFPPVMNLISPPRIDRALLGRVVLPRVVFLTAVGSALLLGCVFRSAQAEGTPRLRVFAAASLTDVVEQLAPGFPAARIEASFGGSSALARQIRDGAPADVFLSADPGWIDFLRGANALDGEPIVLARNRLVCISSRGSALARRGTPDARSLLDGIGPDGLVAVADEGVPAGEYARAALRDLDLLSQFERRLVGQKDVRAVLHAVEKGELEAGFVYATDAKVAEVEVLFRFDPATHPPIEYRAAVVRGTHEPAASRDFLDYLQSETARRHLADAGFTLP